MNHATHKPLLHPVLQLALYLVLLYFSVLMVQLTLPYFAMEDHVGFLQIKQSVIDVGIWKFAFYVHVFSSCFLLVAGFTQFSRTLLVKDQGKFHKWGGILYVFVLLCLSGPSGLVMGVLANGGFYSRVAFVLLSVLWIYFTSMAYLKAKQKDWDAHARFMIRSFALTLSALTLRAWKVGINSSFAMNPMDTYRIVAWLGWVPNLLLAEWLIFKGYHISWLKKQKRKS